jgi:hypothetical protein
MRARTVRAPTRASAAAMARRHRLDVSCLRSMMMTTRGVMTRAHRRHVATRDRATAVSPRMGDRERAASIRRRAHVSETTRALETVARCVVVGCLCALAIGARASTEDALVAIGDVHGDPDAMFDALRLAGVVDGESWWRRARGDGGATTVVQTGDLVDRGARSIDAIDAIERLREEASSVGDEIVGLLGNHELMTLQGDYRFIARDELNALGRRELDDAGVGDAEKGLGLGARAYFQTGKLAWAKIFARGAERGDVVREKSWAVVRGRGRCATAFAHAGLLPEHLLGEDGVDALNAEGRRLLAVDRVGREHELLLGDGPVWTREISMGAEPGACDAALEVTRRLGVRRLVVGHTVTKSGRIETRCDGLIHMIDVGMSRLYGGSPSAWTCVESQGPVAISSSGERVALE